MGLSLDNPFLPGAGHPPPVRAGHGAAAGELNEKLRLILAREPGDIVVMYGPRGNGKTSLLLELMRAAEGDEALVRTLDSDVMERPRNEVADYLVRGDATPRREDLGQGLSAPHEGLPRLGIRETLAGLAEGTPLLLCVDEAHEMCLKFGKHLLQAAQDCIGRGRPLLLVLAGTPLLPSRLSEMGVGFWERCPRLPIGRLESDDDVREALSRPARDAGLPFDDDALGLLVAESERYPFFVQLLGYHSWEAATGEGGSPASITLRDARRGVEMADEERVVLLDGRLDEAGRENVRPFAEAVSKAMVGRGADGRIREARLERVLEDMSAGSDMPPVEAQERLEHLGVIWSVADGIWEPGLPSLCSHFVKHSMG